MNRFKPLVSCKESSTVCRAFQIIQYFDFTLAQRSIVDTQVIHGPFEGLGVPEPVARV